MKTISQLIILFTFLMLFNSCSSKVKNEAEINETKAGGIEITKDQFASAKMEIGEPQMHVFNEGVKSSAYLRVSPDGIEQINVVVEGRVKNSMLSVGRKVTKGQILFTLESNEIIQIQQEYAQVCTQFELAKSELNRIEKLVNENIIANKDLFVSETKYKNLLLTKNALAARLKMLNINVENVEKGEISAEIPIVSHINGHITNVNVVNGEFIEPQKNALEIIDNQKLQLLMNIFEKDLVLLSEGQTVNFYEPDHKSQIYTAKLKYIGKSINNESKTIPCIAEIEKNQNLNLVNGMYAECNIVTNERETFVLPTDALIKDGYNHYVLIKIGENESVYLFNKVRVEVGIEAIDFTEILTPNLENVLLSGVYNLSFED